MNKPGPMRWLIGLFVLLFFVLPMARGASGLSSLFILVAVAWLGWWLIRVGRAASVSADVRRAPPAAPVVVDHIPEPAPQPIDDGEAQYRALEARLAELAGQRDRGEISNEEHEAKRAEAFRSF